MPKIEKGIGAKIEALTKGMSARDKQALVKACIVRLNEQQNHVQRISKLYDHEYRQLEKFREALVMAQAIAFGRD